MTEDDMKDKIDLINKILETKTENTETEEEDKEEIKKFQIKKTETAMDKNLKKFTVFFIIKKSCTKYRVIQQLSHLI
jgi:hypothetical protein